ncbi:RNA-directed DNA polymerase, eukaryota, reverse transcriptase zinc-binding domain protein, partial [Tanacetum coccineum]
KFRALESNVVFPPIVHSSGLNSIDHDHLEANVSLDEIKSDLIKTDILEFINSIFELGLMPQGANSSFFTLIPKSNPPLLRADKILDGLLILSEGDPLSSFLFILIMEGLHSALYNAVNSGLIRGINLGSPDITISHLFYADDVVVTTEWKKEDLDNIIRVLYVFYLASGLKINIHNLTYMTLVFLMKKFLIWLLLLGASLVVFLSVI